MKDLTVLFYYACHQSRTNIYAQAHVSTQSEVIIQVSCYFILKHYPFEPFKLTKLANGRYLVGHNHFSNLPIQFVNAICNIRPYMDSSSRQLSKSLFGVQDLMSFLPEPFFSSFISLLAAFDHGVNGSVCFK